MYGALVEQLNVTSPAQAQNLLVTAKRKFVRCLREVIADYVSETGSIKIELQELYAILAHAR